MKAEISRVQLDIDYKCPNCYLHFRLSNDAVPYKDEIRMECVECRENLTIPILSKHNKENNEVKSRARNALVAQGFSSIEATQLIDKSYLQGISVADLIKESIKNVRQSSTTKV
jgi:hypothetical protein